MTIDREPPARIAYLVGRYPKISHTFITREVRALRDLGIDVHTFSVWPTPDEELLTDLDRAEAARTVSFLPARPWALLRSQIAALAASPAAYARVVAHALRTARPGLRGRFLALSWVAESALLRRELRRRGIRHVHAHLPGTAPAVAMLCTALANHAGPERHTWSLTVHGPSEFYDVHNQAVAEKVRSADFAVAISDFGRSQLMGLVEEQHWGKLHVVHCGVVPSDYEPVAHADAEGPLRLVTVGRLAPVKGQALLLEAVRDLAARGTDVALAIIGHGPKRDELESYAAELGVSERVEFTGPVGQDEITRHYRAADAYVHASFAEGLPVVLMEAMAHGLPVVAAGVMGIPEIVAHEENGLVVRPGRVEDLVAAVERLAGDPEGRRRMGEAGRRTVEREFDVRRSGELLRALFARYAS
jgi:glycosyltransferase involved in cell wall biosynthesis